MEIDSLKLLLVVLKEKLKYLVYRGFLDLIKDILFVDYREVVNCYFFVVELGLDLVVSSSMLVLKYIFYVVKMQFDIDFFKKYDINVIKCIEVEDMMNNMRDECIKEGVKINKCNEIIFVVDGVKSFKVS